MNYRGDTKQRDSISFVPRETGGCVSMIQMSALQGGSDNGLNQQVSIITRVPYVHPATDYVR